jgi:hypothetical protein
MDERLRYEQLIGGKLESLPLPDMQDAIWQTIKAQLDIDLPSDDDEGGPHSPGPSGPGLVGWGLSILLVALVTTFFLVKNKPNPIDKTVNPEPAQQIVTPAQKNNSPPPDNKTKVTGSPVVTHANTPDPLADDSVVQANVSPILPVPNDSVQTSSIQPTLGGSVAQTDSSGPVKKNRGVKGLNDSDYRIVPKNKNQRP